GRGAAGGLGVREVRHDPARPGDLAERHRLLRDPQVRVQRGAGEGMGYEVPAIPHRREPDPRIAAEPLHQRRGPREHASGACANTADDRIGPSRAGDHAGGARCCGRRGERSDRQIQQGEQIVRTRDETVRSIADRTVDLLVIGGGIIGAGIARDAALRGLSVALVEQADFASGTTSRPTRLIHGGLRYLELFDFGLVRSDMREREILLRIAPHLVFPLPFLLPLSPPSLVYQFKLRLGMQLYDWLSLDKTLPKRKYLDGAETLAAEPNLKPDGLTGAWRFYDAQVPLVERLVERDLGVVEAPRAGQPVRLEVRFRRERLGAIEVFPFGQGLVEREPVVELHAEAELELVDEARPVQREQERKRE